MRIHPSGELTLAQEALRPSAAYLELRELAIAAGNMELAIRAGEYYCDFVVEEDLTHPEPDPHYRRYLDNWPLSEVEVRG